jgi:hypothetical protein
MEALAKAQELADTMLKDFEQHGIVPDEEIAKAALRDIPRRVRARAGPGRQAHTADGDQHGPKIRQGLACAATRY